MLSVSMIVVIPILLIVVGSWFMYIDTHNSVPAGFVCVAYGILILCLSVANKEYNKNQ